jgi:hypothetical protein
MEYLVNLSVKLFGLKATKLLFSYCGNCTFTIYVLLIIGIGGLYLIFYIFKWIAITDLSYNDSKKLCDKSNLWILSLTDLILSNLYFLELVIESSYNNLEDKNEKKYEYFSNSKFVYFSWYTVELFGVDCVNNLSNTILYQISYIIWISHITALFIFVFKLFLPKTTYHIYIKNLDIENNQDIENNKDIENVKDDVESNKINDIINPIHENSSPVFK